MSQPIDPNTAQDPSKNYERSKPEEQSPSGKLDQPNSNTPAPQADRLQKQSKDPKSEEV